MTQTVLRIDASARREGSVTRDLNSRFIERLKSAGDITVINRDLMDSLPQITEAWIGASYTAPEERSEAQKDILTLSDTLIDELKAADTIVIGVSVYNFAIPAALKAWVDLVSRKGVTFQYSETGPVGLLTGKRAIVTMASGGTKMGSDIDFATPYLRHILGFIGITDVSVVGADQLAIDAEASIKAAYANVDTLTLAA